MLVRVDADAAPLELHPCFPGAFTKSSKLSKFMGYPIKVPIQMLKETSSKGVSSLLDLLDDVAKVIPCCVIDGLFD